jgi:membrane protein DedA with SNARE-associated domain
MSKRHFGDMLHKVDNEMAIDNVKWGTTLQTQSRGVSPPNSTAILPEAIFLTLAFLGSIGGCLGGALLSKLYLNNFHPIACGMIGCAIGCFALCAVGQLCAMLFHHEEITRMRVSLPELTEKSVEEEVHECGNHC